MRMYKSDRKYFILNVAPIWIGVLCVCAYSLGFPYALWAFLILTAAIGGMIVWTILCMKLADIERENNGD